LHLPEEVREAFRAYGRAGGFARSARLTAQRRSEIARLAVGARWIRRRFGSASFAELGLPGGDIVDQGLTDLAAGRASEESLAVSLAAPRLRREGVPVPREVAADPESRLYARLGQANPELAHSRYTALSRRLVSFADACPSARIDRD